MFCRTQMLVDQDQEPREPKTRLTVLAASICGKLGKNWNASCPLKKANWIVSRKSSGMMTVAQFNRDVPPLIPALATCSQLMDNSTSTAIYLSGVLRRQKVAWPAMSIRKRFATFAKMRFADGLRKHSRRRSLYYVLCRMMNA